MKRFATLVPYVAVLIGMYLFHNAWLTILLYHFGVLAFLCFRKPKGLGRRIGAGVKSPLLIPGMLACALAAPIIYFMWPWFAVSDVALPEWLAHYGLTGGAWIWFVPYFSLVHPVVEEVHWRGISPERVAGICWQDWAFAGYHVLVLFQLIRWPGLVLIFGILGSSSIFWRWAAGKLGGYGLPILTHAVADAAVMIGVCFLLNG